MAATEPSVGDVVGDRFRLEKRIGTGGFGSVWRAQDEASRGGPVALKVLHDHLLDDARIRTRFEREATILTKLDHPSIAKCLAWDIDDAEGYLALEFVDGITLARGLLRHARKNRPFDLGDVRRIFGELCAAIEFAHQQDVVHRDIKPANIMLMERAGTLYVKVLDFGVAKIIAESGRERTNAGTLLGSLHYMGPEQAKGHEVDHRADIFALGSVLFEMLTLRRAWLRTPSGDPIRMGERGDSDGGENNELSLIMRLSNAPRPRPTLWREGLPPGIDEALARALASDPEARYGRVEAFAREVDQLLAAPRPASPRGQSTADLPMVEPTSGIVDAQEPTPTPAPSLAASSRSEAESNPTFETSRPEAFMEKTAALWSQVDKALSEDAPPRTKRASKARVARRNAVLTGLAALLIAGLVAIAAHQVFSSPPRPAAPAAGRIVDSP